MVVLWEPIPATDGEVDIVWPAALLVGGTVWALHSLPSTQSPIHQGYGLGMWITHCHPKDRTQ